MTAIAAGRAALVGRWERASEWPLLIGGIALLGTVSATLASWLVETVAAEKEQAEDPQVTVRRLEHKINRLAAENHDLGSRSL